MVNRQQSKHKSEKDSVFHDVESIFNSWLALVGWITAFCINSLMISIYMIPLGFAGGAIFLVFLIMLVSIGLGILYFGAMKFYSDKIIGHFILYIVIPIIVFVCMFFST